MEKIWINDRKIIVGHDHGAAIWIQPVVIDDVDKIMQADTTNCIYYESRNTINTEFSKIFQVQKDNNFSPF